MDTGSLINEMRIELLQETQKSKFKIVLGILTLLVAILWIPVRLYENISVTIFDWIYVIIFLLNGLNLTMLGLGIDFERLIGKSFIHIGEQVLKIKPGVFAKEQSIRWDNIDSIACKPTSITFIRNDTSSYLLKLENLEYLTAKKIKVLIYNTAKKKDITIIE